MLNAHFYASHCLLWLGDPCILTVVSPFTEKVIFYELPVLRVFQPRHLLCVRLSSTLQLGCACCWALPPWSVVLAAILLASCHSRCLTQFRRLEQFPTDWAAHATLILTGRSIIEVPADQGSDKAPLATCRGPPSCCVFPWQRQSEGSGVSLFLQGLIPSEGPHSHDLSA